MAKKVLDARVYKTRRIGRLKMRWMDNIMEDLQIMRVAEWGSQLKVSILWRSILEEAKAQSVL